MDTFKLLLISEDVWMREVLSLWLQEPVVVCKFSEISWRQIEEYEAVILDCTPIEEKNRIYNSILNLRCFKNEILILLAGVTGSLQERTNLLKAGADDLLLYGYSKDELLQKVSDLKNIYWYKKWKRKKEI